jgi:hypothetical protein
MVSESECIYDPECMDDIGAPTTFVILSAVFLLGAIVAFGTKKEQRKHIDFQDPVLDPGLDVD